jgi:hypothetical protein
MKADHSFLVILVSMGRTFHKTPLGPRRIARQVTCIIAVSRDLVRHRQQQISGHLCAHFGRGLPIGFVLPGQGIDAATVAFKSFLILRATLYQARGFG